MQQDNVVPLHPHGECLSLLAIALLAAHERAASPHEVAHLETCERCQERVRAGRGETDKPPLRPTLAARLKQLRLSKLPTTLPRLRWPAFLAGAMASTLAAGLLVAVHSGPTLMPQPGTAAQVNAVVRDAHGHERALHQLTEISTMHADEHLRLQVRWPVSVRARVEDSVTGDVFFDGTLPGNGWLPVSIAAPGAPLRLRLYPRGNNTSIWSQVLGD